MDNFNKLTELISKKFIEINYLLTLSLLFTFFPLTKEGFKNFIIFLYRFLPKSIEIYFSNLNFTGLSLPTVYQFIFGVYFLSFLSVILSLFILNDNLKSIFQKSTISFVICHIMLLIWNIILKLNDISLLSNIDFRIFALYFNFILGVILMATRYEK